MFYHKYIGLLQTTEFAQEPFECPDRPKLGQLTVLSKGREVKLNFSFVAKN